MTHRKIIGANIRAARLAKGWTQEKLAMRAKLNSDYLSTLERGLVNVSVDALVRIGKVLGISLADIVGVAGPAPSSEARENK